MYVGGIDLSLTGTGVARSAIGRGITTGHALQLVKADEPITALPLPAKLIALDKFAQCVVDSVTAFNFPDLVAVESPTVVRAAGGVFERGYVYYRVTSALLQLGVPLVEVAPTQLKQFVAGTGSAGKGAMIYHLARLWPQYETNGDDNLADAGGLAALALSMLGWQHGFELSAPRVKALKLLKVVKP